ncbi:MAG: hypothetical protein ISS71_09725 [Phycisphaerae bacterium]|nr:hypothetical protein [Phycisphaerae bacterium]
MKQLSVIVLLGLLCICGCDGLRFAATEAQKENAWLHGQVCAMAAETAEDEEASQQLCGLTTLAHQQSEAFVIDYGLPQSVPATSDVEILLAEGATIAQTAQSDATQRPDVWALADNAMELGIALAGLIGGVYGVRVAGYLKTARDKSKALKEIIEGNELFKQLYPEQTDRFKEAQQKQSAATKQLVTQTKTM